jgi:hypothetical protein
MNFQLISGIDATKKLPGEDMDIDELFRDL